MKHRWTFSSLAHPAKAEFLRFVPGVVLEPTAVSFPSNAQPIVESALEAAGAVDLEDASPPEEFPRTLHPGVESIADLVPHGLRAEWADRLFDYQIEAVAFAQLRKGSAFWHSPGAGKTLSAITWALCGHPPYVFITRAPARLQVAREIHAMTRLRAVVLESSDASLDLRALAARSPVEFDGTPPAGRVPKDWMTRADFAPPGSVSFFVVGWESITALKGAITRLKPSAVIFDEVHRAKNYKRWNRKVDSDTGEASFERKENITASASIIGLSTDRRLATTATPVKDRPRDYWAQMDLIEPGEWGAFLRSNPPGVRFPYAGFAARYCAAHKNRFGGIDTAGRSNAEELQTRLSMSAHIVPRSVTHAALPPKRRMTTRLTPDQLGPVSAEAKKNIKAAVRAGGSAYLEAQLVAAATSKRPFAADRVVSALEGGQKVVVLTGRIDDCQKLGEMIEKQAKKDAPDARVWIAPGSTTKSFRENVKNAYMASIGPACIVGTIEAWGESMNLQDTDLAVVCMLPYTPAMVEQLEGRFTRHGQSRKVLIEYLVAEGSADEHVASILIGKLPAVEHAGVNTEAADIRRSLGGLEDGGLVDSILSSLAGDIPLDD